MSIEQYTPEVYGRLTVISKELKLKRGKVRRMTCLCKCSCGNTKEICLVDLKSGSTQSCGCQQQENRTKHGHTKGKDKSKVYLSWSNMWRRCTDPNNNAYVNYGARGITIDDSWKSFEQFLLDMGTPPPGTSLDRKDNNKGYGPSNCRWADRATQNRNTRSNTMITHEGKSQCASAWAEEKGIPKNTLYARFTLGWSVEKALNTPVHKMKARL